MPSSEPLTMATYLGKELDPDLEQVCVSLQKSYSLSPSDLFYKIESYRLQLGGDTSAAPVTRQLLENVRVQLQKQLERKQQKQKHSSPVTGLTPAKRKFAGAATTPTPIKSSPLADRNNAFATRTDAGKILETLNPEINVNIIEPNLERAKITAFMDIKKYQYRTMRQGLLEASEYLDERIEQFGELLQRHFKSEMSKPGNEVDEVIKSAADQLANPGAMTHDEVIVVGRIVSDSVGEADKARINAESALLECSRMMGSGARIPLRFSLDHAQSWFSLFPGQIVALRGHNPTGDAFVVRHVLDLPDLEFPVSSLQKLRQTAAAPTRMIIAKGPFTTQDDLAFAPLIELIDRCIESKPDVVILMGPFIDATHPQLFNPEVLPVDVNSAEDLFKVCVSGELRRLESELPTVQSFLIPESSIRESVQRHLSFPTPPVADKKPLGMPKRAKWLCNPSFVAVNSTVLAVANVDVLMQLSRVEYLHHSAARDPLEQNLLARGVKNLLSQRSLYPVFPSQLGIPLEVSYLGLAEMTVRPDILIAPSEQRYFARVVDNVVAINPGALTKQKAAGTYAIIDIAPLEGIGSEGDKMDENRLEVHKLWERCRVDIKKI
ncbi:DNA polymerase alpha subunit B N-terminal-domain-containing protein [Lipomyces arxii]|uniref:DNA polymerase alpha subunit B N-terminal-domain-containing protein n=1 Tax=Lipomyces arxii TaxID=56418 RepID=UPI0034CEFAE3